MFFPLGFSLVDLMALLMEKQTTDMSSIARVVFVFVIEYWCQWVGAVHVTEVAKGRMLKSLLKVCCSV